MAVQTAAPLRRDPRLRASGLQARFRPPKSDDGAWRPAEVRDLSVGGALIVSTVALEIGARVEVCFTTSGGPDIPILAEVLRTAAEDRGAVAVGLRFVQLSKAAAGHLADVLNAALTVERPGEAVLTPSGPEQLSAVKLQEASLYEWLKLDPGCSAAELRDRSEMLIESVARSEETASGRRHEQLRLLRQALERLRPLWADPVKRVRYDFRWGHVRADARLAEIENGGVDAFTLRNVWRELFRERVREAEEIMAGAEDDDVESLAAAIELDPFHVPWREALSLASPPSPIAVRAERSAAVRAERTIEVASADATQEIDEVEAADLELLEDAPDADPFAGLAAHAERSAAVVHGSSAPARAATSVRGSLADMPLRDIVSSLGSTKKDAEIELALSDGTIVGLLGLAGGDVVIAACGALRGDIAFRALLGLTEARFQVRYAAPREALRHMRESIDHLLLVAFMEPPPPLSRSPLPSSFHLEPVLEDGRPTGVHDRERERAAKEQEQTRVRAELAERALLEAEKARIDAERRAARETAETAARTQQERTHTQIALSELTRGRAEAEQRAAEESAQKAGLLKELEQKKSEVAAVRRVSPLLALSLGACLGLAATMLVQASTSREGDEVRRFDDAVALASKEPEKAAALLEALLADRPDRPVIWRALGDTYARANDRDRALAAYTKYVETTEDKLDAALVRSLLDEASKR